VNVDNIRMTGSESARLVVSLPSVTWTATAGVHTIYATADTLNEIVESGEGNNDWDLDIPEAPTGVVNAEIPRSFRILQNYPNPFNPLTKIAFDLPADTRVRLEIFDAKGRRVRILVDETRPAGSYEVVWNGDDNEGRDLPSGVYLYRVTAGSFSGTKQMTLVK